MKGSFVKDCLLFQSKESLHKFLWLYSKVKSPCTNFYGCIFGLTFYT